MKAICTSASDPLVDMLRTAPYDDEPQTDEERQSSDEPWARHHQCDHVELDDFSEFDDSQGTAAI